MKKLIALLLVLAMALSLAACGAKEEAPAETAAPQVEAPAETAAPETEAPAEESEWPKTIVDVVGNEIILEAPATRLVGTHNPTMNMAVILGGGGKYIAGFGNKEMADVLYSYVYPELQDDVIQIGKGKNINYETVLTTDADLAILPQRFAYMVEEFNAIDIPAIVILTSKESYDTIRNALPLVGQVTGEEDRAAEIIAYFDSIINKLNECTASVTEKPSVMFLGSSNMYSVAPGAMIQSDIMETAGAVNAVTGVDVQGSFADVSAEEIVGWNPDIIWVPNYADYTVEDVLNAPKFQSITAVQNGAVYTFPCNLEPWDYPSTSACLGAATAILLGGSLISMQLMAFAIGRLAVLLSTSIPKILRNKSNLMLVLSGTIVGGFMCSVLDVLKFIAEEDTELSSIIYWQMGSVQSVKMDTLMYVAPIFVIGAVILVLLSWQLNILSFGENEARTLGVNLKWLRGITIVISSMLTASAVSISGTIARTVTSLEVPLSILTGLIGAPIYAWLLWKQKAKVM